MPHSAPSLCPYCDAELFPAPGAATSTDDEVDVEVQAA